MKKAIIILVISLALVLTLMIGLLYSKTWNPQWNPFRPEPQEVLSGMILKMKDLKSFRFESNFEIDGKSIGLINSNFNLDIDRSSDKNLKLKGLIKIPIVSTELQFIKINKDLYLDLGYYSGLLDLLLSSLANGDLNSLMYEFIPFLNPSQGKIEKQELAIKDKWMKFDEDSYKKIKEIILELDKSSSGLDLEGEVPELPKDAKEKITQNFFQLLSESKFYNIKELPDDKINNQPFYRYQFVIDKDKLKDFLLDFIIDSFRYAEDYAPKDLPDNFDEEIEEGLDNFMEEVGDLNFEVWIGQKDNYLYRFKFAKEKIKEEIRSLALEVNFSEFNKPIEIKPPAEFTEMNEVLEKVLAGTKTIAPKERDSKRKRNIDDIKYYMKNYYQYNKKYFQSNSLPVSIPMGTGSYKYNYDIPEDPGNGPCSSYKWVSNVYNAQKFCIYACLESGEIYAANEIGSKIVKKAPATINECTSLFPSKTAKDCPTYCNDPESWNPPEGYCYCGSYDPVIPF